MNVYLTYFKKLDLWMVVSAVLLVALGLGAIFSYGMAQHDFSDFQKQLVFFVIGLCMMVGISFFDWRLLRDNSYALLVVYFLCLAALAGLHFFAPDIRGTRGWYRIGFLSLDPIEPTKIVLIALLAKYFSMRHVELYKFRHIALSGMYMLFPTLLVFIKPDLGGTTVLLLIWLGILMVSGIKLKHFINSKKSFSFNILSPNSCAFFNLLPASAPATT
jgi:rod shape determining protein RodA